MQPLSTSHSTPHTPSETDMPFHQYSRLFTSGLLSEPSVPPEASVPPGRLGRRPPPLETTDTEPPNSRACSFLELADSLASPTSPTDPSHPLDRRTVSVATGATSIRKSGPAPMRKSVLKTTSFNAALSSPTADSFPHLSIISISAGQSFLITEPPLPDSPTLTQRPSQRAMTTRPTSSASLSIKSETRRMNRLAALACLEGRKSSSTGTSRKRLSNFIIMSDDEDEDDYPASPRRPSTDPEIHRRLSAITAGHISMLTVMSSGEKEAEHLSSDPLVAQLPYQCKMAPVKNRHRSRTMESWFPPFANFIDLRNEEDPPNWRSFIEFSTAAA